MQFTIFNYIFEFSITNKSKYHEIDSLLAAGEYAQAIKKVREFRRKAGGDDSLKACKEWCDARRKTLLR